jgi:hypothetical protein
MFDPSSKSTLQNTPYMAMSAAEVDQFAEEERNYVDQVS